MTAVNEPKAQTEFSCLQLVFHGQAANAPEIRTAGNAQRLNGSGTIHISNWSIIQDWRKQLGRVR